MMVKQLRVDGGFTLLECLLVVSVMSICVLMGIPSVMHTVNMGRIENVMDELVMQQYEAINSNQTVDFYHDEYDYHVRFNRRGNVDQARSIYILDKRIIVSLGTGRVYVKQGNNDD